jgi:hypothetical protein
VHRVVSADGHGLRDPAHRHMNEAESATQPSPGSTRAAVMHISPSPDNLTTTTTTTTHRYLRRAPHARATMRSFLLPAAILALAGLAAADDLVTKQRIKVQLFAAPAFVSEVSVDAYHMQCLSLDNNLCVRYQVECDWAGADK